MKKSTTKVLAVFLALLMLASAVPTAFAATEVASGTAGEDVNWVIDSDGTLTISGNGEIQVAWYDSPWKAYNDSILNIVIEEGITLIPGTAFDYAHNCVSVTIPASVETIETYAIAFTNMNSLERIIVDSNNANYKSVDGILFSKDGKTLVFFPESQGATEYTIPDTVETVERFAFYNNACLKKVNIPDTVKYIGQDLFSYSEIEEVSLGNGVTEINFGCFIGTTNLESFVVPDTVTRLYSSVFFNSSSLKNLVIGSGVEHIGSLIIAYSDEIEAVHYHGTQAEWDAIEIDENNESLFSKPIHFVEEKEGVAPTCKNGNGAGLYCSLCDKYFTGDIIPAVSEHSFDSEGVCGNCGEECEHSLDAYVQTETSHYLKCDICGYSESEEVHDIGYYNDIGNGKCVPYCYECGEIEALSKPHSMTAYYNYDEKNCIVYCENCGYNDETTGLVPHSMTDYNCYDEDYCIICCNNCGYGNDETGLVEHSFEEYVVPGTETEAEYTKKLCLSCGYSKKEYNTENAIVFELYSEYEAQWENSAILVYVNGEPVNLIRNMSAEEYDTFAMPYDENSSYVFKWIKGDYHEDFGVDIYLPGSENPVFGEVDMSGYEMLQTIYSINVADYSDVDAALADIPDYLEYYTADSVAKLVTAVKGVKRMLPESKQSDVDAMAVAIEKAIDGLVEISDPVPNGVINMSAGNYVYINDEYYSSDPGYGYYNDETGTETFFEYEGKYVILETESKDDGEEDYVHYGIYTYTGKVEFDIINTFITGYYGNFGVYDDADVTINLYGANAFACYDYEGSDYAGVEIEEGAKLTINDADGSLIAIGQDDQAGIGSEEDENNGEIVINGSTIFALSLGDGAGIGGGNDGGAGKITINGGKIRAESMSDDGAGIGVGDDGEGGEIIINGGDITALSLDDDGAGIGGADCGYIDSITINGGNIVAGSEDGAAIGGGQDEESFGGKITINGGNIAASEWHDVDEYLIGNGSENSVGETDYNYVEINGGFINVANSKGIYPAPRNKNGKSVEETTLIVSDSLLGKKVTIELSNGEEYDVMVEGDEISLYIPDGVTVTNADELLSYGCSHICHRSGFMSFIWNIILLISKLLGINPVCECGAVHY